MPCRPLPRSRRETARSRARAAAVALAAASPMFLVGCIEDGTITRTGSPVGSTTTSEATSTSTTISTPSNGAPSTSIVGSSGGAMTTTTRGTVSADEVSHDDSWWASPGEYRGRDGLRVEYTCPADGALSPVWGTGPFTDDSSVCSAAVFEGLITLADGGRVVVRISPGADSYATDTAHGVTTEDYGIWAGSFDIVG